MFFSDNEKNFSKEYVNIFVPVDDFSEYQKETFILRLRWFWLGWMNFSTWCAEPIELEQWTYAVDMRVKFYDRAAT